MRFYIYWDENNSIPDELDCLLHLMIIQTVIEFRKKKHISNKSLKKICTDEGR